MKGKTVIADSWKMVTNVATRGKKRNLGDLENILLSCEGLLSRGRR